MGSPQVLNELLLIKIKIGSRMQIGTLKNKLETKKNKPLSINVTMLRVQKYATNYLFYQKLPFLHFRLPIKGYRFKS